MHDIRSSFVPGEGLRKDSPVARKRGKPRDESLAGSLTGIAIPRSESRTSNHRSEDRQPNLVSDAALTIRRRKVDVEVVNVSSKGAMLRSTEEAYIGERVTIRFADCNRLVATVRWVKDGRVGLEFDEQTEIIANAKVQAAVRRPHLALVETEAAQPSEKQRALASRSARLGLIWSGTLYWTYEAISVKVRNISPTGAMLDCEHDIPVGDQIRLNLAEAGTLEGEVRWSRGGQAGVRFYHRFDLQRLACARPAGFVAAATTMPEDKEGATYSDALAALWNKTMYFKARRK